MKKHDSSSTPPKRSEGSSTVTCPNCGVAVPLNDDARTPEQQDSRETAEIAKIRKERRARRLANIPGLR